MAKDLAGKRGASAVIAGERQTALTHAVAHAINAALGNVGTTVTFTEPALMDTATGRAGWQSLIDALQAGKVDTLVITAWNPVFTAPGDVDLTGLLKKVPNAVYLGLNDDETSRAVNWFLPAAHPFETWGDARAREGTLSIVQPLIQPLFGGISEAELLGAFLTDEIKPYDRLKALHAARAKADFDTEWEVWLASGVVPGTASPAVTPGLQADKVRAAAGQARPAPGGVELDLVHDYKILDGRYSLNSWLQELPDPITKMTWDNVAQVGPGMAKQLGIENGDLLLLTVAGRSVQVPAWVQPGHSDEAVTVSLGYGRRQQTLGVKDADEPVVVGHDVYPLRSAAAPWFATGLEIKKVGKTYPLSFTQVHSTTEGRAIALMQSVEEFEKHPEAVELRPPVKLRRREGAGGEHARLGAARGRLLEAAVQVGDGGGHEPLHRVHRLRRRLPGREQHPGGRQVPGRPGPRDALDPHGPVLLGPDGVTGDGEPAHVLPALRDRALRVRVPGERHRPLGRGPERHGVQPVHRHPVLLEQLPLQGPPLQLPPLDAGQEPGGEDDAEPGRHRPGARSDGEVHVLRAAHRAHPHRGADREPGHR